VVHSGSAGSTYAINPRAAANGHWIFSVMGRDATRTPHAVDEIVERFGPLPQRTLPRFEETDYVTRVFTEHVLCEMDPDVALIWFNEPDTSFHYKFLASEDTNAILRAVDAAFGRILAAIMRRPDADDIAIIAASDHGQISSSGVADIATLLTGAGHKAARGSSRAINGTDITVNRPLIVIENNNQALAGVSCIVERLHGHTTGQRSITDNCDDVGVLVKAVAGIRKARGGRQSRTRVACTKSIMDALFAG
jgi:hypothetical protein